MKLFVTDYDGTLFQRFKISPEDLEAISKFRQQGHLFGIASGRHLDSLNDEIQKHKIDVDFLIGNNGAAILDHQFRLIHLSQLERQLSIELLGYMRQHFLNDFYFVGVNNGYSFAKDVYQPGASYHGEYAGDITQLLNGGKITALFGELRDPSRAVAITEKINRDYGHLVESVSNAEYIDVATIGNNKASAVQIVADYYQIESKNITVVGDAYNDVKMLQTFDGYVINSGYQEVVELFEPLKRIHKIHEILK